MSWSIPRSFIRMMDPPDVIANHICRALTDSEPTVSYCPLTRPGTSNLIHLMSLATGQTIEAVVQCYKGRHFAYLKKDLADALVNCLQPFQKAYFKYRRSEGFLRITLLQGAEKAREEALKTINPIQSSLGPTLTGRSSDGL